MDQVPSNSDVLDRGRSFRQHPQLGQPHEAPVQYYDLLDEDCFKETHVYIWDEDVKFFIPWNQLLSIVSPSSVRQALTTWSTDSNIDIGNISEMASTICFPKEDSMYRTSFRTILGILVMMGRAKDILAFVFHHLDDSKLPFSVNEDRSCLVYVAEPGRTEKAEFLSSMGWSNRVVREFFHTQFSFISPFLVRPNSGEILHYRLHSNDILPVVEESTRVRDPNSGHQPGPHLLYRVNRLILHDQQYDFGDYSFHDPSAPNHSFAHKRLAAEDRVEFRNEVAFLKRLNSIKNDHLNKLLVTYEVGPNPISFHMIFPWAESDLLTFWSRPRKDTCTAAWIAQQCAGLASAIAQIHDDEAQASLPVTERVYGRHGDVSPRNILWFPNHPEYKTTGGILVLNDFGLAKFHSRKSRSCVKRHNITTSLTYRPPECDVNLGDIGRKFDIWCLGAVYLELLVWYLKGYEAVNETFPDQRSKPVPDSERPMAELYEDIFFEVCGNVAKVNTAVTEWIANLRDDPKCKAFLWNLLEIVENDMLVVDPKQRISAGQLADRLQELEREHYPQT